MRWCGRTALLAAVLLTGCTTLTEVGPPPDQLLLEQQLRELDTWQLRGRLAFKDTDGEGGQANLRWWQTGDAARLRIAGPFGAGAYELTLAPEQIVIRDAAGERRADYAGADAVEEFLRSQLGWSFPVTAARFWVLGLADPATAASITRNAEGRLDTLEQYGWRISYLRFTDVDGLELPAKLRMNSSRAELRMVVSRWTLTE